MASERSSRGMSMSDKAVTERWDKAIDRILNSGLMYAYMEDFWRYIDGQITWAEFDDRMSP